MITTQTDLSLNWTALQSRHKSHSSSNHKHNRLFVQKLSMLTTKKIWNINIGFIVPLWQVLVVWNSFQYYVIIMEWWRCDAQLVRCFISIEQMLRSFHSVSAHGIKRLSKIGMPCIQMSELLFTRKTQYYGYKNPHFKPKTVCNHLTFILGIPVSVRPQDCVFLVNSPRSCFQRESSFVKYIYYS